MPDISVVILTYNSEKYIGKLLKSLISKYKDQIRDEKLEIIVADNNSSDDTIKIASKVKEVTMVQNGGNFGFAKGINLGAPHAKGEFLFFINPDSVLLKGDIFSLKEKFMDNKVAIVGGKILKPSGGQELSCGKFYNLFNVFLLSVGLEEKLGVRFSPKKERHVDFVSGGFMMVRKNLWRQMGGFDENFFMYIEDMELCFRARKKKLKVLFSNSATIQHVGQASSNRTFAVVNIYKGLLYFHKKHMGAVSFFLVRTLLILKAILLVIIGKMSNNKYLGETYMQALKASL